MVGLAGSVSAATDDCSGIVLIPPSLTLILYVRSDHNTCTGEVFTSSRHSHNTVAWRGRTCWISGPEWPLPSSRLRNWKQEHQCGEKQNLVENVLLDSRVSVVSSLGKNDDEQSRRFFGRRNDLPAAVVELVPN